MSIKHSFSSGKADDADATLVNPSDWNAAHDPALTTKGDIIARSGSAAARLGVGSNDEALIAASGETLGLKYAAIILASLLTTRGDIIFRNATVPARLAKGTSGFVLKQGANDPLWAIDPAQDLVTTAGDILIATAADTLARLGLGAAGALLKVNSGATAPEYLAIGTAFQALRTNSGATAPEWADHPKIVLKSADEDVTSSTMLQDDNDLKFAIAANEDWVFEFFIIWDAPTAADIKFSITIPSGATGEWALGRQVGTGDEEPTYIADAAFGSKLAIVSTANNTKFGAHLWGTVINGSNAGNVQLQFAQNTSDGTPATVFTNSWLKAYRVT